MKQRDIYLLTGLLFFGALFACKDNNKHNPRSNFQQQKIKLGKQLAARYCQSCHLLPDPSLLDKNSWTTGVLPNMGPRLGIFQYFGVYPSSRTDKNLPANFYPPKPVIDVDEWQNIFYYYATQSPDTLQAQHRQYPIQMRLATFSVQYPRFKYNRPASTYVKIATGQSAPSLIVGDALRRILYFFNSRLQISDSVHCSSPVVDIEFTQQQMLACEIGNLNPNNGKSGKGKFLNRINGKLQEDSAALFDSLMRPVQITSADLNKDGRTDYLVCEFGNLVGALSWMENLGNNKFSRHTLRPVPGAIKACIDDYNHDGLPDIWVLFAQGEEGVFLFTNMGSGNFSAQEVLRFPPAYGSSSFELDDFNHDGYPDILYTCGDNADFSPVLKPYHGVYIFLNDGTNHFVKKFFFPINGCYKAIARDFDGDGDLDVATISFFADYKNQPEEGFVYLENKGNFDFHPYSLPEAESGRWLTMDAGDINGDGKIDIILGNFSVGPSPIKSKVNWQQSPPFLVLKNTGR